MTNVQIRGLTLNFGSVNVLKNLDLDIKDGEFLVLLGASGCGKSTLLNCIAGLLDVSDGQIFISGKNVTWEEPSKRGIGMVFQSYALYPQMTVERNLSFGLRNAGVRREEIRERVRRVAGILQIEPLLSRKPAALSGGQRQRVAIGRALVRDVDVFLFDEPLSNLDAKLRAELRVEIKRLHQRIKNTVVYVTHDQVEAMTLADRIAIMNNGLIYQLDTPSEIYSRPANMYVAEFIGSPSMNFIEGKLRKSGAGMSFAFGDSKIPLKNYPFTGKERGGENAVLGVRPEHVAAGAEPGKADFTQTISAEVVEPMGADTLVWTTLGGAPFKFRMDGQAKVEAGSRLRIGFDVKRASLFDAESKQRL